MNNHISEHLGRGVEGSCSRCHTLELAHYQYAKNDPDLLLRSFQISLNSKEIPVQIAGEKPPFDFLFFKSLYTVGGGVPPSHSHPPARSFHSLAHAMHKSFSLGPFLYFHP